MLKGPCAAVFRVPEDSRQGALRPEVSAKERNTIHGHDRDHGIARIDRRRRDTLSCLYRRSEANRRRKGAHEGCSEDSRPRRECHRLADQVVPDHQLSLRSLVGVDTVMVLSGRSAAPARLPSLQSDCCRIGGRHREQRWPRRACFVACSTNDLGGVAEAIILDIEGLRQYGRQRSPAPHRAASWLSLLTIGHADRRGRYQIDQSTVQLDTRRQCSHYVPY